MEVSFSRLQIVFLLLLSLGISNHVLIIPHLLQAAKRDAWFSILLAYLALIGWSLILYLILKSIGKLSFYLWLKGRVGMLGLSIVSGCIASYLIAAGIMIVFDTTKNVSIYFLPRTPDFVVILSFIYLAYMAAKSGLKTIVYMSTMLLPIVWMLGIGVSLMTKSSKDYGMLHPLLKEGLGSQLSGGVVVFGGSIDLMVLLLIQHKLSKPLNYGVIFLVLTLLIGLIMGPTLGSLAAFGPYQAANLRFPAFEQWRLVMIGRQISHVDFLAAFQLMAGSIVRTALIIHLISELAGVRSPKYRQVVMLLSAAILSLPSLFKVSDIRMQEIIHNYFYTYSLWFGVAITAVLFTLTYIPQRKGKGNESIT
ncbi:GerAB/ArcD/ProY family transporter [Paenibacillus qinlingensis]|uniref:GerAB/ArcD/ProY family transporter n=1 Tax=Paenibacillus qinlingensis TaxID=1837343 RepID=UPI0015634854|nr:GerAB/ArcD/ProY family transporter [Paenibacillus qinlingensis]NQX57972.1 GerAB/ArcD/ProY family transporter [Paenibacillus qinlingensis]